MLQYVSHGRLLLRHRTIRMYARNRWFRDRVTYQGVGRLVSAEAQLTLEGDVTINYRGGVRPEVKLQTIANGANLLQVILGGRDPKWTEMLVTCDEGDYRATPPFQLLGRSISCVPGHS